MERYWLQKDGSPWREVTREEFVSAEKDAGFYPKSGCGSVATNGFSSSSGIAGKVTYGQD